MFSASEIVHAWQNNSCERQDLVDEFMAASRGNQCRYVLGRNEYSATLAQLLNVEAVVDDFSQHGDRWAGKNVIRSEQLPPTAIVLNCSMSIYPVTVHKKNAGLGIAGVILPSDLYRSRPGSIPVPDFVQETRMEMNDCEDKYDLVYRSLADEKSKKTFMDVMRFRLTGDYASMMGYSTRLSEQYFEDFLGLPSQSVFVDAGGYDGDTTEEFVRRYPDYGKVFLFEPSSVNIEKAKRRLGRYDNIVFIQQGVSNAPGTLCFNPDNGSASSISSQGECMIDVATIDHCIHEKVSFIKMDLEGWELKALQGSQEHIKNERPKLAIAVYHHPSDFWKIFDFVKGLSPSYNVYLRHYTEGWSETVMYFV